MMCIWLPRWVQGDEFLRESNEVVTSVAGRELP